MKHQFKCNLGTLLFVCMAIVGVSRANSAKSSTVWHDKAGIPIQGLAVVLGDAAGDISVELAKKGSLLVHCLATNPEELALIRTSILAKGLYGLASAVEGKDWANLPYANEMANLVVINNFHLLRNKGLTIKDVYRILMPNGLAVIQTKIESLISANEIKEELRVAGVTQVVVTEDAQRNILLKRAATKGYDDWTHWDYGPEGNALSRDTAVGPPSH